MQEEFTWAGDLPVPNGSSGHGEHSTTNEHAIRLPMLDRPIEAGGGHVWGEDAAREDDTVEELLDEVDDNPNTNKTAIKTF